MADDDLIYSTDYGWQFEREDNMPDPPPDPYKDDRTQNGNTKPRDEQGDHYSTTREIPDGEMASTNAGEIGAALSGIEGFAADDIPLWDGEE
jgi:hypothetical protein